MQKWVSNWHWTISYNRYQSARRTAAEPITHKIRFTCDYRLFWMFCAIYLTILAQPCSCSNGLFCGLKCNEFRIATNVKQFGLFFCRKKWALGQFCINAILQYWKSQIYNLSARRQKRKKRRWADQFLCSKYNFSGGFEKSRPPLLFVKRLTTTLYLAIWPGGNRRMPSCATKSFDIKRQEASCQKKYSFQPVAIRPATSIIMPTW